MNKAEILFKNPTKITTKDCIHLNIGHQEGASFSSVLQTSKQKEEKGDRAGGGQGGQREREGSGGASNSALQSITMWEKN